MRASEKRRLICHAFARRASHPNLTVPAPSSQFLLESDSRLAGPRWREMQDAASRQFSCEKL
jgi:hypothetical protein